MSDNYWRLFCDEVAEEVLGVSLTDEQRKALCTALIHHREMEYEACGYVETDRSVVAMNAKEHRNEIVREIESVAGSLYGASGRIVDLLNHEQKMGLARLLNFREYLRRETRIAI